MSLAEQVSNTFKARDYIVEQIGQAVPGTDLVEILAYAMTEDGMEDMTLDEVKDLVITVAKQRIEAYEVLKDATSDPL